MNQVTLLILTFDITFNDTDEGRCYAGDGMHIIEAHRTKEQAKSTADVFNLIIEKAEAEKIVFPIQPNNNLLKYRFGFTLHDFSDACNFKLITRTLELV